MSEKLEHMSAAQMEKNQDMNMALKTCSYLELKYLWLNQIQKRIGALEGQDFWDTCEMPIVSDWEGNNWRHLKSKTNQVEATLSITYEFISTVSRSIEDIIML